MKRPVEPRKPYPPYKPIAPTKRIVQARQLGKTELDKYESYTFESFHQTVISACKDSDIENVEQEKVKFSFEVDNESTYYDDVIVHLNMKLYVDEEIDNPNFDVLQKNYEKNLKKYEVENNKYKADMKQFKLNQTKYEKEYPVYMLEFYETQAKILKKKTATAKTKKVTKGKV